MPAWDDQRRRYLDPATGELLPTWDEALDAIGPSDAPLHVARFGPKFDVQGVTHRAESLDPARARRAVPYRKVGLLLRFPEAEVEEWTHPRPRNRPAGPAARSDDHPPASVSAMHRRPRCALVLPKSLIEQEDEHVTRRSA
jgi:hypothetical protein